MSPLNFVANQVPPRLAESRRGQIQPYDGKCMDGNPAPNDGLGCKRRTAIPSDVN